MKFASRIMMVIFALVALLSHGMAQPIVFHDHEPLSVSDAGHHSGHSHADVDTAALDIGLSGLCGDLSCAPTDTSGEASGHFHISCCGAFLALPVDEPGIKSQAVATLNRPVFRPALPLGALLYPLLRPPRTFA